MKNFIIAVCIFLIWAFIGMKWYYSCSWCSPKKPQPKEEIVTPKPEIKEPPKPKTIPNASSILVRDEQNSIVFSFNEPLTVFKDSTGVSIPENQYALRDSIFYYLNKNQNKELILTGWYTKEESKQHSDSLNYGYARATAIKTFLSDFGINKDKISLNTSEENYMYTNNTYFGGVLFNFKTITKSRAIEINKGITKKTLYTRFNSRNFKPDNTLQAYAAELKDYLSKHSEKTVSITGHTDSLGEERDNKIIAIDRANNVKKYLISQGVPEANLKTFSKGELEPIADNSTKEGQAKNRRIEITIN